MLYLLGFYLIFSYLEVAVTLYEYNKANKRNTLCDFVIFLFSPLSLLALFYIRSKK